MLMTPQVLEKTCKENGGYRQPHLNDQLFLQCRGFCEIANLEPYVELKALWLEQNAIQCIEGLDTLQKLASLFLQSNTIRSISGLSNLRNLRTLNLSHNYLAKLTDLRSCALLETLQISHNRIERLEDMEELWLLPELSCLDVSHNKIDEKPADSDDLYMIDFFRKIPKLSVLYFQGQDLARKIKNYRKLTVFHLQELTYLDERPVFPAERRTTNAWGEGGADAEKAELEKIRDEKKFELTQCLRTQEAMKSANKDIKEQREKEYQEQMEKEKKLRAERKLIFSRYATELDHDEYEQRAIEEQSEEAAWNELLLRVGESLVAANSRIALRKQAEREDAERLEREAVAAAEIEKRMEELAVEAATERAKRQAHFDEIQFWVKKLAQDDAAIEAEMQAELTSLLSHLQPPNAGPHQLPSDGDSTAPTIADETASTASRTTGKPTKNQARWTASAARFEKFYAMEAKRR